MDKITRFLMEIGKLKSVERTGWVFEGVQNPESVGDHSFRSAVAVVVLGKGRSDIDLNKAVKMALLHDIAESQIGDVIVDWKLKAHGPEKFQRIKEKGIHGVTQEEKLKREKQGMEKLASFLGPDGNEFVQLWEEFEEGKTKEAKFVKSVEVFEMFLQAFEYEEAQKGVDISTWFTHQKNWEKITDAKIRSLLEEIVDERKKRPNL